MYNRKKPTEEVPMVKTKVWACESDCCNGWMRDNFSFHHSPVCVMCDGQMISEERMLPALVNTIGDLNR